MMSMNLDWERDNYGSYIAQLPHSPGYQDTFSVQVSHFMGISAAGDWHLEINNRPNPSVFLYDIPGIVCHAKTPEQLISTAEGQFTPGMVANLLRAEGYEPVEE